MSDFITVAAHKLGSEEYGKLVQRVARFKNLKRVTEVSQRTFLRDCDEIFGEHSSELSPLLQASMDTISVEALQAAKGESGAVHVDDNEDAEEEPAKDSAPAEQQQQQSAAAQQQQTYADQQSTDGVKTESQFDGTPGMGSENVAADLAAHSTEARAAAEAAHSASYQTVVVEGSVAPRYPIFIGDLPRDVMEEELKPIFAQVGDVHELSVIRDKMTGTCKGYGFVFFCTPEAQQAALSEEWRARLICRGRLIRTNTCEQKTTLVLGGLSPDATVDAVLDEVKLATGGFVKAELKVSPEGKLASSGLVTFESYDKANEARRVLHMRPVAGKPLVVAWLEHKDQQMQMQMQPQGPQLPQQSNPDPSYRTLWVSSLPQTVTDEALRAVFDRYGTITKVSLPRDPMTQMLKGFAFIEYDTREAMENAMRSENGREFMGSQLMLNFAKPQQRTNMGMPQRGRMMPGMMGMMGMYGQQPQYGYGAYGYQQPQYAAYNYGNAAYAAAYAQQAQQQQQQAGAAQQPQQAGAAAAAAQAYPQGYAAYAAQYAAQYAQQYPQAAAAAGYGYAQQQQQPQQQQQQQQGAAAAGAVPQAGYGYQQQAAGYGPQHTAQYRDQRYAPY